MLQGWAPYLKRFIHFLFLLLMVAIPLSKGLASAAMGALGIMALVMLAVEKDLLRFQKNWPILLPVALFLVYVLSTSYSDDQRLAWKFVKNQLPFLIIPGSFFLHRKLIQEKFPLYLLSFVLATTAACIVTLIFYVLPEKQVIAITETVPIFQDYVKMQNRVQFGLYSPFMDRIPFSNIMAIGSFCIVYLMISWKEKLRPYLALCFLLIGICALLLGGRGGQLGMMTGLLIWLIFGWYRRIHPLLTQRMGAIASHGIFASILIFALVIAPLVIYKTVPAVSKRYTQLLWEVETFSDGTFVKFDYTHFTGLRRLLSWKNTGTLIGEQPILGTGVGDYQTVLQEIYDRDGLGLQRNSHNQYLFVWANVGLWGFAVFLWMLGYWLWLMVKRPINAFGTFVLSIWICWIVVFLFDAGIMFQINGMLFCICWALLPTKYLELKA